jgi:signal transduction histidine kinase
MKVLIAEDDPISRRLLQGHLTNWGHEVTAAEGGGQAWQLFRQGSYPLVISDWVMPEMDGLELVRRIRECPRSGYVYVILLTAKARKEDVVQGMEAGADDFVTKPFDREELRVRLRAGERIVQLEMTLAQQNQALREAQAALVQNEKLASLGRLAAGIAHEINNPIAFVSNNVTVLHREIQAVLALLDLYRRGRDNLARVDPALAARAAQQEQDIDLAFFAQNFPRLCGKAQEGLQRIRAIVSNLRDFACLDEATFKEIDLKAALESVLEILRSEIGKKRLRVTTHWSPLPPVLCHPGKINQVFLNILSNAVEACPLEGFIALRTGTVEGKEVVIDIQDNGPGIAPEHRARLFEPFFTTKPVGQGTGLGLAVSFGIVRDHGGVIEVDSEVGRGSIFRIRLPVQPTRLAPPPVLPGSDQ